jgi:hypothetical protein
MLRHTTGEWYGKSFNLMPWQEQIIRDIFGIVDKETGYRQFRTAYVEIGKKNGNTARKYTDAPPTANRPASFLMLPSKWWNNFHH